MKQSYDTAGDGAVMTAGRKPWRRPTLERMGTDDAACMAPGSSGDALSSSIGDMKPVNCS